jgi:hypothetical protein
MEKMWERGDKINYHMRAPFTLSVPMSALTQVHMRAGSIFPLYIDNRY